MAGVIVRDFSGKMNLDAHPSRVGKRDYIDALNITRNAAGSKDIVANIAGNRSVSYALPSGTSKCIGSFSDPVRNRVIACYYNSAGYHEIIKFDKTARTITKIIRSKTDTGGTDILNFGTTTRIRSIDVIHRDEGDLIFINDALNKPIAFNIDTIGSYAPNITDDLIRLAKKPPLLAPDVSYVTDDSFEANNHRKKLYQFCYRLVYKDGYKSVFSPYSKTELPVDGYNVSTNRTPSYNNAIDIQVTAGGADFQKIEIAFRECLGTTMSDFYLIDSIDRDDDSVNPQGTYTLRFFNDGAYPPINVRETEQLYDLVPDKALAQTIVNGNTLVFGGITEGYTRVPRSQSNVQVSYRSVDTSPNATSTAGTPSLSYTTSTSPAGASPNDYRLFLYVGPEVGDGYLYHVKFTSVVTVSGQFTLDAEYEATSSDTQATVTTNLRAVIDAALGPNFDVQAIDSSTIRIEVSFSPSVGAGFYQSVSASATAPTYTQGSEATWKHNSQYTFALLYRDAYGKPLAIMSFDELDGDTNVYSVRTPNFVVNASNDYAPRVPLITGTISHAPVAGATTFQWLRTKNQSVSKFLQYITCKVEDEDGFIYLCIENLDQFRTNNPGFVPSYTYANGDRVRVMCTVDNNSGGAAYTASYYEDDYEILGVVDRTITEASEGVEEVTGRWLKVTQPSSGYTYNPFMLIEVYTPALSTTENLQVFYEFGETYPIYVHSNGNRYHTGNVSDQNASQAAHFDFADGDVYFRFRKIYNDTFSQATGYMELGMMDANYSDYWNSAVNSDGRPYVLEPDAKRQFNPALVRFGGSFQPNTNLNELNRFYELNYDEYVRSYGQIEKLISWNNSMIVFQKLKVGKVPVYQSIIKMVSGQDVVESDKLLNKIDYYLGENGMGDAFRSVAVNRSAIYWWDTVNNKNCRLSQNGIDVLSDIYEAHQFGITNAIEGRNISAAYDPNDDSYITAFEQTTGLAAKTIVYNENAFAERKGYSTFLSYQPEEIAVLDNLIITWKNGVLYTHDSTTYNNFYGTQYDSYVTGVFNDDMLFKKTIEAISFQGTSGWSLPEIKTNTYSYGTTQQSTYVNAAEFRSEEGYFHAEIGRDDNSTGRKSNGDYMKGEWATIKFKFTSASSFVYLLAALLKISSSHKQPL